MVLVYLVIPCVKVLHMFMFSMFSSLDSVGHVGVNKLFDETACQGGSIDKSQSNRDCLATYEASSVDHPTKVRKNSSYLGTEAQGSFDKSLGNTEVVRLFSILLVIKWCITQ